MSSEELDVEAKLHPVSLGENSISQLSHILYLLLEISPVPSSN